MPCTRLSRLLDLHARIAQARESTSIPRHTNQCRPLIWRHDRVTAVGKEKFQLIWMSEREMSLGMRLLSRSLDKDPALGFIPAPRWRQQRASGYRRDDQRNFADQLSGRKRILKKTFIMHR